MSLQYQGKISLFWKYSRKVLHLQQAQAQPMASSPDFYVKASAWLEADDQQFL